MLLKGRDSGCNGGMLIKLSSSALRGRHNLGARGAMTIRSVKVFYRKRVLVIRNVKDYMYGVSRVCSVRIFVCGHGYRYEALKKQRRPM